MSIAASIEKLPAIKGMLVIITFQLDRWIGAVKCALCEYKYDYINLSLNDNSSQIHCQTIKQTYAPTH